MFQIACLQLLQLCINLHIPVSWELLSVAWAEKTAGITRTSFEAIYQQECLDVHIGNFFLPAGIIGSSWNLHYINVSRAWLLPLSIQAVVDGVLKSLLKLEQYPNIWFTLLDLCY